MGGAYTISGSHHSAREKRNLKYEIPSQYSCIYIRNLKDLGADL
jgi:hypothetical protein